MCVCGGAPAVFFTEDQDILSWWCWYAHSGLESCDTCDLTERDTHMITVNPTDCGIKSECQIL